MSIIRGDRMNLNSKFISLNSQPSWVIFLSLVTPFFIGNVIPFGYTLMGAVIVIWLFIVAFSLNKKIPSNVNITMHWFIFNLIYFLHLILFI